jgi:hypothetical protein
LEAFKKEQQLGQLGGNQLQTIMPQEMTRNRNVTWSAALDVRRRDVASVTGYHQKVFLLFFKIEGFKAISKLMQNDADFRIKKRCPIVLAEVFRGSQNAELRAVERHTFRLHH